MLPLLAYRFDGRFSLLHNGLFPVHCQLQPTDAGHRSRMGLLVRVMRTERLPHQAGVGRLVPVVPLHGVVDRAYGCDTGSRHADFQPLLIGDCQHCIELERVELVSLRRNGHSLTAPLVLGVLDHHQELVVPQSTVRLSQFPLLGRVPGDSVESDHVHLVGGRVPHACHLDAGRHAVVRPGHALNGQRVGASIGKFFQLHQVFPCACGAVCGCDFQNSASRELGQQGRPDVGYFCFRPARRHLVLLFHSLPPY